MSQFSIKILIVDDEPDIIEFLKYNLEKEGYMVFTASNGNEAIDKAKVNLPDLIVLDIMMPQLDGIEVCRVLREMSQFEETLIIFLSARTEAYSELAGFGVGADDYITKPIRPRVLLARIKALLKRKKIDRTNSLEKTINRGSITIDIEKRLVKKNGLEIILPKKEFDLLVLLSSKPGKVFTREEIHIKVWGGNVIVGLRTLDVHIRKLRKKIGTDLIRTTKGIGYAFVV